MDSAPAPAAPAPASPRARARPRRPRLTYANVVATIALLMATGGTSYAAKHYAFTTSDIKDRSLRNVDLRKNTLTGNEVAENTLGPIPRALTADVAASSRKADYATGAGSASYATTAGTADAANLAATAQSVGGISAAQLATTDASTVAIDATAHPLATSTSLGLRVDSRTTGQVAAARAVLTSTRTTGDLVVQTFDDTAPDGANTTVLTPGTAKTVFTNDMPVLVWSADAADVRSLVLTCSATTTLEHCVTTRVGGAN